MFVATPTSESAFEPNANAPGSYLRREAKGQPNANAPGVCSGVLMLPGLDTERTSVPYRFGVVARREAKGRLVFVAA